MVELTTLFGLAETLAIIVGVIIALQQLRDIKQTRETELETRQAQLLMQIYQRMNTPEYMSDWAEILNYEWDSYEDFELKYGSGDHPDCFGKRASIWRILDGVGLLVKEGLLDVVKVYELMDTSVIWQWMKWEPIIKEQRIRYGFPDQSIWFEYLADEMFRIRRQRGVTAEPSETFGQYTSDE